MRDEGYGAGYEYDHDLEDAVSGQGYFPDDLPPQTYYQPTGRGLEQEIQMRLKQWSELKKKARRQ